MSMDGLRKGAANIPTGKGKGASRPIYYTRWKPPQMVLASGTGKNKVTFDLHPFLAAPPSEESKVEAAEPVVLIPGQYEDFYAIDEQGARVLPPPVMEGLHFRVHNFNVWIPGRNPSERGFNSFREMVCSSGPEPHAPQPCVGCYQVDHGQKDSRARDNWAFNMAHLVWYHLKPLVKDNVIQMKKDGSGPVMVKEQCSSYKMEKVYLGRAVQSGRASADFAKRFSPCEGCQQRLEYSFGEHRVLQLGYKHLKNLFEIDDHVGKKCINCGSGILRVAFDCEKCGNELLDLAQVQWTNDQITTYSKQPAQCGCGHVGLPKSGYECGFDENFAKTHQGCDNPVKTTIFDCVLWLQREGESVDSEVVVKRVELIPQYKTQDNRPLADHLKEIVKQPFDLADMYKPDTLDDQAETIKQPNPYAPQQPQYGGYPGGPQPPQGGYPQPGQPPATGYPQPGYPPQPGGYYGGPPPGFPAAPGGPVNPQPSGYAPPPQTGYPQPGQPPAYPNAGRPNFGK